MTRETDLVKYVYDRDGNEIVSTNKATGAKFVSEYDRRGFLVERKCYVNNELSWVDQYKYETDQYGNWIKQVEYTYLPKYADDGFTPSAVTCRDITYYKE